MQQDNMLRPLEESVISKPISSNINKSISQKSITRVKKRRSWVKITSAIINKKEWKFIARKRRNDELIKKKEYQWTWNYLVIIIQIIVFVRINQGNEE